MTDFNRAEFTAYIAKNTDGKATREAIFDLLGFADEHAFKVRSGKENKTFQYIVRTTNGSALLFWCDCGSVTMKLGNFPQLSAAAISLFVRRLCGVSNGFNYLLRIEDNHSSEQSFAIKETLVDPATMKVFKTSVLALQDEISQEPTNPLR